MDGTREAWVLATLPRALAFATSLLRDRALAEDVAHDCYVRLLAKADTYDLARDGTKLLYKAITNACIDKNYRDRRMLSLEVATTGEVAGTAPVADRRGCDPCELAAQRELEEAVAVEISQLTVAQRGALELSSLGYSLEEIAEALGTSASNAGVLVHRARKVLAGRLARFLKGTADEPSLKFPRITTSIASSGTIWSASAETNDPRTLFGRIQQSLAADSPDPLPKVARRRGTRSAWKWAGAAAAAVAVVTGFTLLVQERPALAKGETVVREARRAHAAAD